MHSLYAAITMASMNLVLYLMDKNVCARAAARVRPTCRERIKLATEYESEVPTPRWPTRSAGENMSGDSHTYPPVLFGFRMLLASKSNAPIRQRTSLEGKKKAHRRLLRTRCCSLCSPTGCMGHPLGPGTGLLAAECHDFWQKRATRVRERRRMLWQVRRAGFWVTCSFEGTREGLWWVSWVSRAFITGLGIVRRGRRRKRGEKSWKSRANGCHDRFLELYFHATASVGCNVVNLWAIVKRSSRSGTRW